MSTNPKDVKSQHELNDGNDGRRKSDVLLSTIDKCEQLEKENTKLKDKIIEHLTRIDSMNKVLKDNQKVLAMCGMALGSLLPYCNAKQKPTIQQAVEVIAEQQQKISEV